MQAHPTTKARKHIQERVDKKQCLCCPKPSLKRGLCHQCYYVWRKERQTLPDAAKKAAYDAKLIRMGRLLKGWAVCDYKSKSVFAAAAAEIG